LEYFFLKCIIKKSKQQKHDQEEVMVGKEWKKMGISLIRSGITARSRSSSSSKKRRGKKKRFPKA
jgi:hypothetical protein